MPEVAVEHVANLDVVAIRRFADAKWEAFVDELLSEFFEVYVGVGLGVLVLMGDCWLLLCGCGKMGGHLGCYLRGDGPLKSFAVSCVFVPIGVVGMAGWVTGTVQLVAEELA